MTAFHPLRDRDRAALIALWDACDLTRPWNPPEADLALSDASPHSAVLAVHMDGRLAASVMVGEDGHRAWVYYVAVHPDFRRAGLGRGAMRAAEDWARARGVPKLLLMARHANARVMGFYAALGYVDAEVVTLGKWLDEDRARIERGE